MMKSGKVLGCATLLLGAANSHATNVFELEGFGVVSRGMGGTSSAFYTGVSSLIANPATLSMMKGEGEFLAGLDLVISVDTSVAHLAGAMGKPVWLLLGRHSDWRWLLERNDTPWYPTMRIFRMAEADGPGGDEASWRNVIAKVIEELRAYVTQAAGE